MARGKIPAFAALVVCGWALPAAAAPSARLVYLRDQGAESCPDEAAVRSAVAARLGYDPFFPTAPATMFVEIGRKDSVFLARVKLVDDENVVRGIREISHKGESCAELIDTVALSMSVAIDPDSLLRGPAAAAADPVPSPPPAPPETHDPPPAPPADRAPAPIAPAPPAAEQAHLVAGAGIEGWAGAAPAPSLGANLFVRLIRRPWSGAIEGRYDAPSSAAARGGAIVQTSLLLASLAPCFHAGPAGFCAVFSVGSLSATSRNVSSPRDAASLHAAIGPRFAIDLPIGDLWTLWARADAMVSVVSQTLTIEDTEVYTLPRLSAGLGAGAGVRFF